MNSQLYYSSVIIGFIILFIIIFYYNPNLLLLYILTFVGIITSIVNHGTTNNIAKYIDRIIIWVLLFVYLYYCTLITNEKMQFISLCIIFYMCIMYGLSKQSENIKNMSDLSTNIHNISHILFVILFIIITYNENVIS
jgi:hypothetical protein